MRKAILIILILAACAISRLIPAQPERPMIKTETTIKQRPGIAIGECRRHVKAKLLSPNSAVFSDERSFGVEGKPNNYHAVIGTVEAKNSFGVALQTTFRCDLHYIPDQPGVWVLDAFMLNK